MADFLRENKKDAHLWAIYEYDEEKVHRGWYEDGEAAGKALGKAEDVLELLEDCGPVPDDIRNMIMNQTDLEILKAWHKAAAKAESVEEWKGKVLV